MNFTLPSFRGRRPTLKSVQAGSETQRSRAAARPKRYAAPAWTPLVCQWIEGEPTADDGCKCGAPIKEGSSYCEAHHVRCYTPVLTASAKPESSAE